MNTVKTNSFRPVPIESARYLTLEEFYEAFDRLSSKLSDRIFKLERLQRYIEPGNESWSEFQKGNIRNSLKLLREAHSKNVQFDIDFFRRGLQFLRIRAVEIPLTDYLKWELQGHVVNVQYGETILVADLTNTARDSNNWCTRDFLLFDTFAVLIHDYDANGELRGGWMCEDPDVLATCAEIAKSLTEISVPLGVFLDFHPFSYEE